MSNYSNDYENQNKNSEARFTAGGRKTKNFVIDFVDNMFEAFKAVKIGREPLQKNFNLTFLLHSIELCAKRLAYKWRKFLRLRGRYSY